LKRLPRRRGCGNVFERGGNGALAEYLSALVGNRIWRGFTVSFDYAHAALRLTPNSSFNQH
jgi:hypothetical protein